MPKSMSVAETPSGRFEMMMFAGFTSRWMSGGSTSPCSSDTASQISGKTVRANAAPPPSAPTSAASVAPSTYSDTTTSASSVL